MLLLSHGHVLKKEFEQYVHFPLQDIDSSPLQWWQLQHHQHPLLAKFARKLYVLHLRGYSALVGKLCMKVRDLNQAEVNELIILAENWTI